MSRVLEGIFRVLQQKSESLPRAGKSFSYVSVIIWGIVMYLFERDKRTLSGSLSSSMTFLYHDSNKWERGWRDFIPVEMPQWADAVIR